MKLTQQFAAEGAPKIEAPANAYKPIWQLAAENNAKCKVVTVRKAKHDRIFTGC